LQECGASMIQASRAAVRSSKSSSHLAPRHDIAVCAAPGAQSPFGATRAVYFRVHGAKREGAVAPCWPMRARWRLRAPNPCLLLDAFRPRSAATINAGACRAGHRLGRRAPTRTARYSVPVRQSRHYCGGAKPPFRAAISWTGCGPDCGAGGCTPTWKAVAHRGLAGPDHCFSESRGDQ